jgi:hypothetical protein
MYNNYTHKQTACSYLNHSLWSLLTHVLDGILISQPVGALHRVEEMVLPSVLLNIAQSSVDTTLEPEKT